jgi:hypothetical protein
MKLKHFSFVILAFVVTFNSCKSRKKVAETVENLKEAFWENSFEYLEIKADANATLPDGNNQSFNLFIKMKKDSLIWVSARKFGFEGARAIITKDSFFVINRLDRSYMSEPLTKIKNIIGFESDLSQLQNILVGKALFNRNVYEVADDNDSLSGFKGVQGGLINRFFIDEFALLKKSYLSNFANTQNAEITYTEYIDVNKKITPKILDILAYSGGQKLGCTLNYTNISDKKIDNFAFVVPSNYKKL